MPHYPDCLRPPSRSDPLVRTLTSGLKPIFLPFYPENLRPEGPKLGPSYPDRPHTFVGIAGGPTAVRAFTMLESRAQHLGTFPRVTFLRDSKSRKIDIWELRKTLLCRNYLGTGFVVGPDGRPEDWDSKTELVFRHAVYVGRDGRPSPNVSCGN